MRGILQNKWAVLNNSVSVTQKTNKQTNKAKQDETTIN